MLEEYVKVLEALRTVQEPADLYNYASAIDWKAFGAAEPQPQRSFLLGALELENEFRSACNRARLSREAMFIVRLLFSISINKSDVLEIMDHLSEEAKMDMDFHNARVFIERRVCATIWDVDGARKFPAVYIPSCHPPEDILFFLLVPSRHVLTVDDLYIRLTTTQLFLNIATQAKAKAAIYVNWDTATGAAEDAESSQPPTNTLRGLFYQHLSEDEYLLFDLRRQLIAPSNAQDGYSEEDLVAYIELIQWQKRTLGDPFARWWGSGH